jgi:hypothetical protein
MCEAKLGTALHQALSLCGVSPDRVSRWLGRPCGCKERLERLDALSQWSARVIRGSVAGAGDYLRRILDG